MKNIFISKGIIQGIIIIFMMVIIGLVLAFLFMPQKEEAPPRSKIAYEPKPENKDITKRNDYTTSQSGELDLRVSTNADRGDGEKLPSTIAEASLTSKEGEDLKEFILLVSVIDGESNKPISGAQVTLENIVMLKRGARIRMMTSPVFAQKERIESLRVRGPVVTDAQGKASLRFFNKDISDKNVRLRVVARAVGYAQGEEPLPPVQDDSQIETTIKLYGGGGIEGRVIEEGTNAGAKGVKVYIDESENPYVKSGKALPIQSTIADDDGNFKLEGLMPGTYGLYVSVEGTPYLPSKKEVPYKKVTILSPGDVQKGIVLKVSPAGMIWGYVTNLVGEPVPGAELTLSTSQSIFTQAVNAFLTRQAPITAVSNEDGYYEMGGVPLNQEWRLYVAGHGSYTPQLSDVFALTPQYRVVRVDINLFDGASVSGRVTEPDGTPVVGAEVICMPEYSAIFSPLDQPTAFKSAVTKEGGEFSVTGLPPGNFQILAWKSGYKMPLTGLKFASDGFSQNSGINIILERVEAGDYTVFGKVTNPRGEPLSGADVRLEGVTTAGFQSVSESTTTDSAGNYKFDGINIGYYELRVSYPGYVTRTLYSVKFNQPTDIVLQTFGVVRGQVLVKETNSPLEIPFSVEAKPAPIELDETGGVALAQYTTEPVEISVTDPEGRFEMQIGPGAFDIIARAEGYVEGRTQALVREGETIEVKVYVSKQGGVIAGKISIRGGGNPQGTKVTLVQAESETEASARALLAEDTSFSRTQVVGEDGLFRFETLPEGNYVVIAQHEGYSTGNSGLITLSSGQKIENISIILGTGGILEGHIYLDGKLAPNALVIILGPGGIKTTNADQNGFYQFDGLSTGVYQLVASPVGSDPNSMDFAGLFQTRGVPVEVKEGQVTRFDFGRMGGVRIEGVCNPSPPMGGVALLRPPTGRPYAFGQVVDMDELVGSMSTMVNPLGGAFVFEDVPTGEWQLDVYYIQFGRGVRYVYSTIIEVTGEQPVVNVNCMVRL
ncbi:MAG: carboxypeptidase regulatory-like domain-containing protein [Candidatus Hydrogenedentes bacterium]|nr:carboxypeptidase regulatory-like domain-containing protein [Candidatus Hydrogenedentota bacterium]